MLNLHIPTMCEYCYRARMILACAAGVVMGGLSGEWMPYVAGGMICAAAVFGFIIPAFRNE